MVNPDIFGYIGAVGLSILYLPQVYNSYKLELSREISGYFLALEYIVVCCFTIYAVLIDAYPLLISNSCVALCTIALTVIKIKNRKRQKSVSTVITHKGSNSTDSPQNNDDVFAHSECPPRELPSSV